MMGHLMSQQGPCLSTNEVNKTAASGQSMTSELVVKAQLCEMGVAFRSAGSSLLTKPQRIQQITRSMSSILSCPLTIKVGHLNDYFG